MALKPSYKRLRHLLVEHSMSPVDLRRATGLGRNTMTSINADRSVSLDTIAVICEHFGCRIEDVVEFVEESPKQEHPSFKVDLDELLAD